jgi:hypothetical protein
LAPETALFLAGIQGCHTDFGMGFCRVLQNFFFSAAFAGYTGICVIIGREYRREMNDTGAQTV